MFKPHMEVIELLDGLYDEYVEVANSMNIENRFNKKEFMLRYLDYLHELTNEGEEFDG